MNAFTITDRRFHAKKKEYGKNDIPPITDPLGRSWDQPSSKNILIDDTHALMSLRVFEELAEYSCSFPSGVYPGKMWRRHNGSFDHAFIARGGKPEWQLWWFGIAINDETGEESLEQVTNNCRKIILLDAKIEDQK